MNDCDRGTRAAAGGPGMSVPRPAARRRQAPRFLFGRPSPAATLFALLLAVPPAVLGLTATRVAAAGDEPFRLVSADERGVTLEYEAAEPVFRAVETPFGTYHEIRLAGHAIAGYLGRAGLPQRGAGLAIPEGAAPRLTFEILETREYAGIRPLPIGEGPLAEGSVIAKEGGFALDRAGYDLETEPARAAIWFEERGHLRHHRVGQVAVTPLRLDPAGHRVTLIKRARIRVDFAGGQLSPRGRGAVAPTIPVGTERAWEEAYKEAFLNYESARAFRARPLPGLDRGEAFPTVPEDPFAPGGIGAPGAPGAAGDPGAPGRGAPSAADFHAAGAAVGAGNPEFRLFVYTSGAYYATYADLAARGWPAGIAIDQVAFYEKAYNAANPAMPLVRDLPIHVEEYDTGTPGVFDGDDTIYFYALNYADRYRPQPSTGRFSNINACWLSWRAEGGARMAVVPGTYEAASFVTPTSYVMQSHFEENPYYIFERPESDLSVTYPNVDAYFWLEAISYRDSLEFKSPGRDASRPLQVRTRWQGLFAGTHYVTVWLKRGTSAAGDTLLLNKGAFGTGAAYVFDSGFTIPGARLNDGTNMIKLQGNGFANGDPNSFGSGAYFDWFEVNYHRRYQVADGALRFTSGSATGDVEFLLTDLRQNSVLLFDISDSLAPRIVNVAPEQFTQVQGPPNRRYELRFRANVTRQKTWLLYQADAIPSFTATVPGGRLPRDQGTTNLVLDTADDLTVDTGADVLVLAHPDFIPAFAQWKALRESQGHRLRVVTPQDVYDQFNGGVKSPFAVRNWLRYVYRNWAVAPDNLVLIGDASEDYRGDVTRNPKYRSDPDWVPTMMSYGPVPNGAQRLEKIGTDHWYVGALGTNDADFDLFPEMYIGRIPVGTPTEAQNFADKLTTYDQYTPNDAWRNRGLIVSDDQYSSPLAGFSSYCYQNVERIFESAGDSLANLYTQESCYNGFQVEHFRLAEYLAPLNRPVPPCTTGSCCADASAAQALARSVATPAWIEDSSQGHLFQIYSGHANKSVMSTEFFVEYSGQFQSPDARVTEQVTNYGKPFIYLGIACHLNEWEYFDEGNSKNCLSESMLMLPNRGAIASIASSGYEWLPSNEGIELYLGRSLFTDHPRDPVTGRPRRVLGEGTYVGLIRVELELAIQNPFFYRETIRTYGLLGDPTMRIDMAPPSLEVTVGGEPVAPGASLRAPAGSSQVEVGVRLSDDVDDRPDGFSIQVADTALSGTPWTVTPFEDSRLGACHGVEVAWPAALSPGNYQITLIATDWLGRTMEFPLTVELRTEYRVGGHPVAPNDLLPIDAKLESRVESPVALVPGDVDILVNGETGYFTFAPGIDDREWVGSLTRELPSGSVTFETVVRNVPQGSFSVRVQAELGFEQVYFYPSPWEGDGSAYFTYQLSYPEGEAPRRVQVSVFTVSGRKVTSLDGPVEVGQNVLPWDVRDREGDVIANGVYLFKISVETTSGKTLTTTDRLVVHR